MDRDHLVQLLAEGLSLEQIGVIVGRHPSTIAYWLARHGLRANGRRSTPQGVGSRVASWPR